MNLIREHRNIFGIALAILFFLLFLNPLVIIPAGHRGVLLTWGAVSDRILPEGLNLRIPMMQTVEKVDVRIQKHEISANAASKDLQEITSVIALNFHVDPTTVNRIYQDIGVHYDERIIEPAVQETVKSVTARYTAVELITTRHIVTEEIEQALRARLKPYFINVDQVSTKNFEFSAKFNAAIESKQEAEQLALKAQRDLERVRIEAEQQITTARAEAESYRLRTTALSPLLRDLEWIKKWNGQLPQVQAPGMPLISTPFNK